MSSGPPRDIGGFPWVYLGIRRSTGTPDAAIYPLRVATFCRSLLLDLLVGLVSLYVVQVTRGHGSVYRSLTRVASGIRALLIRPCSLLRLLLVLALRMTSGSLPALLEAVLSNSPTAPPPFSRR